MHNGYERFALIPTDKVANPTSVMDTSKRLRKMITQSFDDKIKPGKSMKILPNSSPMWKTEIKTKIRPGLFLEMLRPNSWRRVSVMSWVQTAW